jgi:hypothetical protein
LLIVAAVVALGMAAIPPWRIGDLGGRLSYAPVLAPPLSVPENGVRCIGGGASTPVRPAWDLLAGQYAALLLATLFALRCLGREGERTLRRPPSSPVSGRLLLV